MGLFNDKKRGFGIVIICQNIFEYMILNDVFYPAVMTYRRDYPS